MRIVSLTALLAGFWLALSGHYTTLLLVIGALVTLLCVYLAIRMRIIDDEGHPIQLATSALSYWPWLVWEIVKSAWSVARIIADPRLPISPTMTDVRASQRSDAGLATFGNSITLTPGTITTGADGDVLTIHALTRDGALDLEAGEMDRRVSTFDGSRE